MSRSFSDISDEMVDDIIESKVFKVNDADVRYYKVQWKCTWEPEVTLQGYCKNIIKKYWHEQKRSPSSQNTNWKDVTSCQDPNHNQKKTYLLIDNPSLTTQDKEAKSDRFSEIITVKEEEHGGELEEGETGNELNVMNLNYSLDEEKNNIQENYINERNVEDQRNIREEDFANHKNQKESERTDVNKITNNKKIVIGINQEINKSKLSTRKQGHHINTTATSFNAERHSSEQNEREYKCKECNVTFSVLGALKRHTRVHSKDRPYQCDKCTKSFKWNWNLKSHLLTHSREKFSTCHICQKSFKMQKYLKAHYLKNHDSQSSPFPDTEEGLVENDEINID